jgi:Rhodopirellula transposase DDE domain
MSASASITIRHSSPSCGWWLAKIGRERYPAARKLMVTADCGGSNGPRLRLWKLELQC